MNPHRHSNRKRAQLLVALTILAWATQTLLHQWARGEDAPAEQASGERFVPNAGGGANAIATLELRSEANVSGAEIELRQVCRWADADRKLFGPLADLTIGRFDDTGTFQSVDVESVRQTLHEAGVNLGVIRFAGATTCTVSRTDVKIDESSALAQWAAARQGKAPATAPDAVKPVEHAAAAIAPAASPATAVARISDLDSLTHTLRERIIADAAIRLNVPIETLQLTFNPADNITLNLSEPQFKFNLEARHVYGLGDVSWDVTVVTDTNARKVPIHATARAWESQVELVKPIAFGQVIRIADVKEKRLLVDHLPDDPLLSSPQCVGQEASRELKPGTVLTARMVSPVDLAKVGQFVTVTLASGNIRIKTVGRAMQSGSYGQTIHVKNEAKDEIYEVLLTGPQEGTVSPVSSQQEK